MEQRIVYIVRDDQEEFYVEAELDVACDVVVVNFQGGTLEIPGNSLSELIEALQAIEFDRGEEVVVQ